MSYVDMLRGRINDADSHENIPVKLWPECFGPTGEVMKSFLSIPDLAKRVEPILSSAYGSMDLDEDSLEINAETVWAHEGWETDIPRAPGAIDMKRRLEVLDFMGVARQQVFPTFALFGIVLAASSGGFLRTILGDDLDREMAREMGFAMIRAHNEWAITQAKLDPNRLRVVGLVDTTDFDQAMAETERMIDGGVRSFFLPASVPPGGKSPADRAMSPFWSLCESAGVTVQLHLAFEDFMRTSVWREIPEFQQQVIVSAETITDPWTFATTHMPAANFLTTMILGGVFERHPDLRFGAIECGAHWVGPLAESLDMWATLCKRQLGSTLSMPPSEYLKRNVRVTPFIFEPIRMYFERYGLTDVYCYGSDYPHFEGGRHQIQVFADALSPLGAEILEKFFVTNAELIMPSEAA